MKKLDDVLELQLENLEELKPGTEEFKDVCMAINKIGAIRMDDYKNQSEAWKEQERLELDRDKLEFEKEKLEFEREKQKELSDLDRQKIAIDKSKQGLNVNALLNAGTIVGLTLVTLIYDSNDRLMPTALQRFIPKPRL